jgi:ubiquinone/menaquinone biosynthesis C-methylase UbiE
MGSPLEIQRELFDRMATEKERKLDFLKTLPQYDFFRKYNSKIRASILESISESCQTVLDAGCGDGDYSMLVACNSKAKVVGVDSSKASVLVANRRSVEQGVGDSTDFVVADVTHLPFRTRCFDLVLALAIFHHLADFRGLDEIARTMKSASGALCHEVVLNNPFALAANVGVRLLPKAVRYQLLDVANGNIPRIRLFTSFALEEAIKKRGLKVVRVEREQLFLFILWYVLAAFPSLARFLPNRVLTAMGIIEEMLISHSPTQSLCRFSRVLVRDQS